MGLFQYLITVMGDTVSIALGTTLAYLLVKRLGGDK